MLFYSVVRGNFQWTLLNSLEFLSARDPSLINNKSFPFYSMLYSNIGYNGKKSL